MTYRTVRRIADSFSMRRGASSALLFLMLADLALHLGEAYLAAPQDGLTHSTQIRGGLVTAQAGDSDCPIPGHDNDPFHHHHFPGMVVAEGYVAPSELRILIAAALAELRGASVSVSHPGRAPPLA